MIQLHRVAVCRHHLRLLRHLLPTFSRWLQHVSCQQQSVRSSCARSSFMSMHGINYCPLNPIVSHCEQHRTYCPLQSHHSMVAVYPASLQAFSRPLHSCRTLARHPRPADPDYDVIFRFPHIRAVRMLCRLKLYQTGLTLAAVPVVAVTQDAQAVAVVVGIGSLAACMLYVMGEFFRRFVGLLYLKRDGQLLKVAHLTFWGGRRDQLIPVGDVVPFSELRDSPGDLYFRLGRYSCADVFYVSLRYGDVANRGKLEAVFGPITVELAEELGNVSYVGRPVVHVLQSCDDHDAAWRDLQTLLAPKRWYSLLAENCRDHVRGVMGQLEGRHPGMVQAGHRQLRQTNIEDIGLMGMLILLIAVPVGLVMRR